MDETETEPIEVEIPKEWTKYREKAYHLVAWNQVCSSKEFQQGRRHGDLTN